MCSIGRGNRPGQGGPPDRCRWSELVVGKASSTRILTPGFPSRAHGFGHVINVGCPIEELVGADVHAPFTPISAAV